MKISDFGQLKKFIRDYIRLLENEYSSISEILSFSMDSFSEWERMRIWYNQRLEQIRASIDRNRYFLESVEYTESVLSCTSSGPDSMYGRDHFSDAEQHIQEKESFISVLDALRVIDVDNISTVADTKSAAADIAATISEASIDTTNLIEQEKRALRRKQLADALINGEPVTVFPDGQIVDASTADAITALRTQLIEDNEAMVNADGTLFVPSNPFDHSGYADGFNPIDMGFVEGDSMPSIQVSPEKLAGGYGMCRVCGKVFNQATNYCPECGTKVVIEKPVVTLDRVYFSALASKTFVKGDYSVVEIFMYEEAFRDVVQEAIVNADDPVKETKSGILTAEREAKITVTLSSPDFVIEDNTESQTWQGDYLSFSFAVKVPEQYQKSQIMFVASVYFNDIIATRLKFVAKSKTLTEQKIEVSREDVLSAFISYASQDRNRVAMIIQGMKKARPDMDIFFDVDSLRSGDDWEKTLWREIDKRDVLFLCWSKYARDSKWVDAEWRYAFKNKGPDSIEPVPIDPPASCPPPAELSQKHFNDKLLYIINSNSAVFRDELPIGYDVMAENLEKLF